MSVVRTLLGNIKGPQGETGATGAQGAQGEAATVNVGAVTTTAYGNPAQVINSGTESEAVLDFVIPQGKPGEATTKMGNLSLDAITTSTASFPSPQVGDTGKTAFGKIVKFFADTVAALNAKLNTANVVNNLATTEAGYALDARQGKALNDSLMHKQRTAVFTAVNRNVTINWANYSFLMFIANASISGTNYAITGWIPTAALNVGRIVCFNNDLRINCYSADTLRLDRAYINSTDITSSAGFYVYAW